MFVFEACKKSNFHVVFQHEELPEARRLRETARQLLGFDPLDGPGVLGFYELLRGPEGRLRAEGRVCRPGRQTNDFGALAV